MVVDVVEGQVLVIGPLVNQDRMGAVAGVDGRLDRPVPTAAPCRAHLVIGIHHGEESVAGGRTGGRVAAVRGLETIHQQTVP